MFEGLGGVGKSRGFRVWGFRVWRLKVLGVGGFQGLGRIYDLGLHWFLEGFRV